MSQLGEIIKLNVGGVKFSSSKETLTWVPDSFFSSMLSGRISSLRDDDGAIFIDRDPNTFSVILNYLRTKDIDLNGIDLRRLRHEAEYYGITPLVRRLLLCESLEEPSCGDILFHGTISPPGSNAPVCATGDAQSEETLSAATGRSDMINAALMGSYSSLQRLVRRDHRRLSGASASVSSVENISKQPTLYAHSDPELCKKSTLIRVSLSASRVTILKGHNNWIVAAYPHYVSLYKLKDSVGWKLTWTSPYVEESVDRVALNAKVCLPSPEISRLVAASAGTVITLWSVPEHGHARQLGAFELGSYLEHLFFSGSQLVALSPVGRVGVWHAMTQNWQLQEVGGICSYDTAGSLLLLGCESGQICYIDMQKFPLRMKDNEILVTELFKDPLGEAVTALSFYVTSKTSVTGNWLEIAYGTDAGKVCIVVQHPETGGQGPQLFQTFTVHTSPITKVVLSEKHLISACSDYSHVRSWSVTRFRGMISTQPGSMPLASFKVASLEYQHPLAQYVVGNDIGPFGDKDDQLIFIQKVVPNTDRLLVRLASSGTRVCSIKSVDGSEITCFCVHECEGSTRMGSRPRRYLFTGHSHGGMQIWDLSTALERLTQGEVVSGSAGGGPDAAELLRALDQCDLTRSATSTPALSRAPSVAAFRGGATAPCAAAPAIRDIDDNE